MTSTLDKVPIGQEVTIIDIKDICDNLLTFGFVKNAKVKVVKTAPCGDPKLISIKGTFVAVRNKDLNQITVNY